MTPESYRTVRDSATSEYEEKKSRFLGFVRPVETEVEARAMIEEIRALHPQARHHVFAYLTDFSAVQRMSDDGEPQGTGGIQLMEPMQRMGYTNLCLVVTRYFGGTLLGAGPLARAYGKAARAALEAAGEALYRRQAHYSLALPYAKQKKIEYELTKFGALLESPVYGEEVTLPLRVLVEEKEALERFLTELFSGEPPLTFLGESYRPID